MQNKAIAYSHSNSFDELFGYQFEETEQHDTYTLFRMINKTGYGTLMYRNVIPGIVLTYDHINMKSFWKELPTPSDVIQINHCQNGQFVCVFDDEKHIMKSGDLCFSKGTHHKVTDSHMPTSQYDGLSISLEVEKAQASLCNIGMDNGIEFRLISQYIHDSDNLLIRNVPPATMRILDELYEIEQSDNPSLYTIKIIEFLIYLCDFLLQPVSSLCQCSSRIIQSVRDVHDALVQDPFKKITIPELAEQFQMSKTNLTRCFKQLYGLPPASFLKSLRIKHAAQLILQYPDMSIVEIAQLAGYDNPSKFSAAFKSVFNITPITYRRTSSKSEVGRLE